MDYSVYMHIAPNNKKYIGITMRNPKMRWKNGSGYLNNSHFYNAIKKYGWNNIEHLILFTGLSKEEAEKKEIELIAQYKTTNRKYGYNNDNGGKTIGTHSAATKEKMKLSHQGKRPFIHKSEEEKEKHRKRTTEKWKDEKARKKMLEGIIKKHGVKVLCVETGKFFNTLVEAGNYYNVCSKHIGKCCKGERKTAGGYHWEQYKEVAQ